MVKSTMSVGNFDQGDRLYINSAGEHPLDRSVSKLAQEALFRLARFEEMEDGWDSYGAARPIRALIKAARSFVMLMDRCGVAPYFVAPGPNGDVMVEYKDASGVEAEVHFRDGGERHLLISRGDDTLFDEPYDQKVFDQYFK